MQTRFVFRHDNRIFLRWLVYCLIFFNYQTSSSQTSGYSPSTFDVTNTGGATCFTPVIVSPGTNQVEPSIAFIYSSQSSNGVLGIGHAITGLSAISRTGQQLDPDGNNTAIEFNNKDRLSRDGDRMMSISSSSYWGAANTYFTEHNPYDRIEAFGTINGSPEYFVVKSKSGVTSEYGRTSDSRVEATGATVPIRWLINKVYDNKGNYMLFHYQEDPSTGETYPTYIEYTGNKQAGLLPYNRVAFEYETRPDITTGYLNNTIQKVTKRLKSVQCFHKAEVLRSYSLQYNQVGIAQKSLLKSIQECGQNGICLNRTEFEYSGEEELKVVDSQHPLPNAHKWKEAKQFLPADFNNDGVSDFAFQKNEKIQIVLGDRNYQTISTALLANLTNIFGINPAVGSTDYIKTSGEINFNNGIGDIDTIYDFIVPGDFNGDGKADLVIKQHQHIECYISQCDGDNISFYKGFDEENGILDVYDRPVVGDFDGNGKDDLLLYSKYGASLCYYFVTAQNQYVIGGILPEFSDLTDDSTNVEMSVADWDGDGIDDLLAKGSEGSGYMTRFYRGQSNRYFLAENTPDLLGNLIPKGVVLQAIDVNNDGLPEITRSYRHETLGITAIHGYSTNKGAFHFAAETSIGITGLGSEHGGASPFFADINLDGNVDILTFPNGDIYRNCILYHGTGNGFDLNGILLAVPETIREFKQRLIPGRYFTTPGINMLAYDSKTGQNAFCEIYTEPKYLLTKIRNGHGQETNITYQPISKDDIYQPGTFPVYGPYNHYRGPLYVVAYVTQKNGTGSFQCTAYKYEGAVIGNNGRGFRGFYKMTTINVNRNLRTVNYFTYDHRYGGNSLLSTETFAKDILVGKTISGHQIKEIQNSVFDTRVVFNQEETFDPNTGNLINKNIRTFDYDDFGNVLQSVTYSQDGRTDSLSNVYFNDSENWRLGRLLSSTRIVKDANGIVQQKKSSFEYDEAGWLKTEVAEPGNNSIQLSTSYQRDITGNIIETKVSGWDGQQVATRTRSTAFDSLYRFPVVSLTEGNFKTTYSYDQGTGKLVLSTDPNGLARRIEYDGVGRPIKELFADGNWRAYQYLLVSSNSEVPAAVHYVAMTDSKGNYHATYYDILERVVREEMLNVNNKTVVKDYVYDNKGDLVQVSLPYFKGNVAQWISMTYDDTGRLVEETLPNGLKRAFAYNGLEVVSTNELDQEMMVIKDIHGNKVESIDPMGKSVVKKFDVNGNVIRVISQQSDITFSYDLRNLLVQKNDPAAGISTFQYNSFGELIKKTTPNGTSTFKYDNLGRLVEQVDGDEKSIYVYDTKFLGKLSSVNKGNYYSIAFDYDNLGNVVKESKSILGKLFVTETTYNDKNEIERLKYPSPNGFQIEYEYVKGEVTSVKNSASSYLWRMLEKDALGNLSTSKYGNNITISNSFDPVRGWLTSTKAANDKGLVQHWSFTFNEIGSLIRQEDVMAHLSENYEYDGLKQLVKSTTSNGDSLIMRYDDNGKIIYKSDLGTYLWNNETGRLDSILLNNGVKCPIGTQVTYTIFGKVESVIKDSFRLQIFYGSDYQRIAQKLWINGTIRKTRYYGGLSELDIMADGTQTAQNFISNGREVFAIQVFNPKSPAARMLYLHKNHLGSTVAISNEQGEIIERLNYDPWGKRRSEDWKALDNVQLMLVDRGFTGHEHYDLFNLIDMNGRVYDPNLGVFLSPDPLYQSLDYNHLLNRYAYVGNNPLSLTDPSGYWPDFVDDAVGWVGDKIGDGASAVGGWTKDNWKSTVTTIATVATALIVTYATGSPILGGMAAGFVGGTTGSLLNGQSLVNALKAGARGAAIGGISATLTFGVGEIAMGSGLNSWGQLAIRTIGHGLVQGGVSKVNGGSFISGATSGALTAAASPMVHMMGMNYAGELASNMVIGGTASQIGGGNFANGAISGAFIYMYNDQMHKAEQRSIMAKLVDKFQNASPIEQLSLLNDKNTLLSALAGSEQGANIFGKLGLGISLGTTILDQVNTGNWENFTYNMSSIAFGEIAAAGAVIVTSEIWVPVVIGTTVAYGSQAFFNHFSSNR